jgi:hypothetical protein
VGDVVSYIHTEGVLEAMILTGVVEDMAWDNGWYYSVSTGDITCCVLEEALTFLDSVSLVEDPVKTQPKYTLKDIVTFRDTRTNCWEVKYLAADIIGIENRDDTWVYHVLDFTDAKSHQVKEDDLTLIGRSPS